MSNNVTIISKVAEIPKVKHQRELEDSIRKVIESLESEAKKRGFVNLCVVAVDDHGDVVSLLANKGRPFIMAGAIHHMLREIDSAIEVTPA